MGGVLIEFVMKGCVLIACDVGAELLQIWWVQIKRGD